MDELVDLLREDSFSEVDVDRNPILVLGCGHVLTMLTLDGLMEMDRYYVEYFDREHGAIEYVGRHDLPGYEPDQVLCPICDEPAVGPLRYGLRLNHLLLAARLRSQHIDQFQGFDKVHKQFAKVCDEVESRRTKVLEQLSKTKRESRMDPPKAFLRVLGNFENKADYYPNSDFAALPPIYKIPVRYRRHWTELVGPAVEVFQSFLRADNGAGLSPLNRLYDAIVGHFKRTASSSTSGQPQKVRALDVDCGSAVKCGFPRGGSTVLSKVESLYGQASVLLLVLSLAFSFLDEAGVASGWYWFVEDLIRCTMIYAGLLIEAAQEGMYRRKVAYARLMRIELICMTLQWIGMEHVAVGPKAKAKRSKQVKRLLKNYMTDDKEIREKYAWVITIDIKKRMVELRDRMVSAVRAARGEDVFVAVSQGEKLRYLFKGATDQEPVQDGQWVLCSNGHGYVLDESTVLMEWRCFECQVSIAGY
ncbi:hypothetical protein BGZ54_001632 [Gamsiella multidivaricata]|nr:hypothetical protein BGZ54_001632 [Gamsiella multidivaricata]